MWPLAIILLCAFAAVLIAVIAAYGFEFRRIASFLTARPAESNLRLDKGTPLPGAERLIRAINVQIDEVANREQNMKQEERELLEGLASLSHDIRTPLAGAKGYVQLAREEDERDDEKYAHFLTSAEARIDAMQAMLDQLFEYTRASTLVAGVDDGSQPEEVDAIAILSSVLIGHYPEFSEVEIEPVVLLEDESRLILVNAEMLRRIFDNVVSNALQHGTGEVFVEQVGNTIRFSNAIGTDVAIDTDLVFKRFYRGDSSRSTSGAGLGLSVVKQLCDLMGIGVLAHVANCRFEIAFDLSAITLEDS